MHEPKRILAVVDPTAGSQPAVERAAALARRIGARLELFICDYDPQLVDSASGEVHGLRKARTSLIDDRLSQLREIEKALGAEERASRGASSRTARHLSVMWVGHHSWMSCLRAVAGGAADTIRRKSQAGTAATVPSQRTESHPRATVGCTNIRRAGYGGMAG